jgi:hypothetical protein
VRTASISETSVDNHFTRQYIPEDNSEHHTRRRENLKSHMNSHACSDIVGSAKSVNAEMNLAVRCPLTVMWFGCITEGSNSLLLCYKPGWR